MFILLFNEGSICSNFLVNFQIINSSINTYKIKE